MPLIIENGSGVINANSFVTEAEFDTYASDRGFTITGSKQAMLIKAIDYMRSQETRFEGYRTYSDQTLPFPRTNLYIYGQLIAKDAIPQAVKYAQLQAALEVSKGVDLMPTFTGGFVKREKVGPIETEYSETVGANSGPQLTALDAIMALFYGSSGGAFLTLRRV